MKNFCNSGTGRRARLLTTALGALALLMAPAPARAFSLYSPYSLSIQGATVCTSTPAAGQVLEYNGTQFCGANGAQVFTSSGTLTTDVNVPWYRVIAVGGGGGGGSSSGAGYGGNGGLPAITFCEVRGGGLQYSFTPGSGGLAATAGGGGGNGNDSWMSITGSASKCLAKGGSGGPAGNASNASGGAGGVGTATGTVNDGASPALTIGVVAQNFLGVAGATGGASAGTYFGVSEGVGCAGASCTTATQGGGGSIWMIPEY